MVAQASEAWASDRLWAISIDVIGTGDRAPVAYRDAIDKEGVHLGEITSAVKVSHGHATARDGDAGCGEDKAFDGESVIAKKRSVGAVSVA